MARPRTLNDNNPEMIEKNFLDENPEIPPNEKVVVAKELPRYEKIIFQNMRDEGITLTFHYASKTHPLKHYELIHGQEYNLPLEVILHLSGETNYDPYACHSRLYSRRMKADGVTETYASSYKPYFQLRNVRR